MARARPRPSRLSQNPRLKRWVQDRLDQRDSPEQIAGRLPVEFPDQEEMRISHETIYRAIYVRPRGELRRELRAHLRTARRVRQRRNTRQTRETRGQIPGAHGATAAHEGEASVNRQLAARARRVAVVADHSKVGHSAFATICPLGAIDLLVTDEGPSSDLASDLAAHDVEILLAE